MKNIFQKIIDGELASFKLYEDQDFLLILDAYPLTNGHLLLISKSQKENILEEDDEVLEKLFTLAKQISKKILTILEASGIKWLINTGEDSGQRVFQTHLHIIPYYREPQEMLAIQEVFKKIKNKL